MPALLALNISAKFGLIVLKANFLPPNCSIHHRVITGSLNYSRQIVTPLGNSHRDPNQQHQNRMENQFRHFFGWYVLSQKVNHLVPFTLTSFLPMMTARGKSQSQVLVSTTTTTTQRIDGILRAGGILMTVIIPNDLKFPSQIHASPISVASSRLGGSSSSGSVALSYIVSEWI